MFLTKLDITIILVTAALPSVVAVVMVASRLQQRWPFFFLYCCFSLLAGVVPIVAAFFFSYRTYFQVYFFCQSGHVILALLAMNEAFKRVFRIYYSGRWFRLLLPSIGLIIVGVSLWRGYHRISPQAGLLWTAFLTFNLGADYFRAAIFGLFGLLVFFWNPPSQPHPFAVMKGFGIYSIVGMLGDLLRFDFGTRMRLFFSYAHSVAYIVACLIWLGAFLAPEPEKEAQRPGSLVNVAELRELLERLTRAIR
jgi:hypothetical protein